MSRDSLAMTEVGSVPSAASAAATTAMIVGRKVLIQKVLPGELLVACHALVLNLAWWHTFVLSVDM